MVKIILILSLLLMNVIAHPINFIFSKQESLIKQKIVNQNDSLVQLIYDDSIKFEYLVNRFFQFDLLTSTSPLLLFKEGIFMPREKLWYKQLKLPQSIKAFNFSYFDTSLYLIEGEGNTRNVVNYKYNIDRQKIEKNLLLKAL